MEINGANIEEIVRQVLNSMEGRGQAAPAAAAAGTGSIPKTARVAMLTSLEPYDIKEFPIPEVGDEDAEIAPGTLFEKLPEDWVCPECAEGKDQFIEA